MGKRYVLLGCQDSLLKGLNGVFMAWLFLQTYYRHIHYPSFSANPSGFFIGIPDGVWAMHCEWGCLSVWKRRNIGARKGIPRREEGIRQGRGVWEIISMDPVSRKQVNDYGRPMTP
jgi:hypothetical protein